MSQVGTYIICLCVAIFGFYKADCEKRRVLIISEIDRLIRYMRNQIFYYRKSLPDILISFQSPLLEECGFASLLADGWDRAIASVDCPYTLKNELLALGKSLGMMNMQMQVESFDKCLSFITDYTENEKLALPSRILIYRCLGLTVSAAILVLSL